MEQVIKSDLIEQETRSCIEKEYEITTVREADSIVFKCGKSKAVSTLCLTPYTVAMRRNPPRAGAKRLPCMADIVRADADYISGIMTDPEYRMQGYMKKVLAAALEYQNRMKQPFTLLNCDDGAVFERYGFHYIYDKPEYEFKDTVITAEMLEHADKGETVVIEKTGAAITALDESGFLTLAHFVNTVLCRKYGIFAIRNARYYEKLQCRLSDKGGSIYLINENGRIKGSFIYIKQDAQPLREVIFENSADIGDYFYVSDDKKPSVMARVVNLAEMLKHISSRGHVSIAIRLTDPVIAENNGLFIWYIDESGGRMERLAEDEQTVRMRPEVSATIGELSAFFFEYIKLKENVKFESIYLTGPAYIDEML